MTLEDYYKHLSIAFVPEAAGGLDAIIQFKAGKGAYAIIKDGKVEVAHGTHDSPTLSLEMSDKNMCALFSGDLNGMTAFMTGRLKMKGDLMLALKLPSLFDHSKAI